MKRLILVPLDGSTVAAEMLPWVWALASRLHMRALLVQVLDPALHGARANDLGIQADPETTIGQAALQQLRSLADDLRDAGVEADATITFAETVEGILATAHAARADLIAMSTHGRSGIGRWLYGSVAEGVLRMAPVPVLLARAQGVAIPDVTAMRLGRHVLVPLDGSLLAEQVLLALVPLLAGSDFEVTLLGVIPPLEAAIGQDRAIVTYLDQRVDTRRAEMLAYLNHQSRWLRDHGISAHVRVEVGQPAEWIVLVTRVLNAAFVAMATHGRTGLARVTHGSIADQVLRQAPVPVLMVRGRPTMTEAELEQAKRSLEPVASA